MSDSLPNGTTQPEQLPIRPLWLTDSRAMLADPGQSVFFAIQGEHHDGHRYVGDLYGRGVRQFVVERAALTPERRAEFGGYAGAQFVEVDSSLRTMQALAAQDRQRVAIPVVGITGSNGKTIVKEWLAQLLGDTFVIVKSPKSYNSQLGVPLSVHQLTPAHTLGIFEAGISKPHEMAALEAIIRPTVGIFTNIGSAHDEGFATRRQKITEKLRLFTRADTLIYRADYADLDEEIRLILSAVNPGLRLIRWSLDGADADYAARVTGNQLSLRHGADSSDADHFTLPFTDAASVENVIHCLIAAWVLGAADRPALQAGLNRLRPVSMRLELKEGIHNCVVVDDSYSNDVVGLQLALRFLVQQTPRDRNVVILSDVLQSGQPEAELYAQISGLLRANGIDQFVGIGPVLGRNRSLFSDTGQFYATTEQFLTEFDAAHLRDAAVLVKGARSFAFERIVGRLQRKVHGTVLSVDLGALTHNLNYYRAKVGTSTKIMVMVKAFAYGSGSAEVARLLQFHRVDYLAVAYADEGVALRQNGITLPIMVMNPVGAPNRPETFATLLEHDLEPELYSPLLLEQFSRFLREQPAGSGNVAVHLKFDTGMHRLGFLADDLPALLTFLGRHPTVRVASTFSHLVGADDPQLNDFSREQYAQFRRMTDALAAGLGYVPTRHLLNSAGIVRFPEYKLDMVRLGIGLYGVESSRLEPDAVRPVGTLRTVISQIKPVRAGDTVGYGRRGQLTHDARIATIAIGYADGFDRRLGNGVGRVWVNGTYCPTVGNVCMDMTMVDVTATDATDQPATEGDEVIIFGPQLPISELAGQIGTIPYEILTGVGERVKRVFYEADT